MKELPQRAQEKRSESKKYFARLKKKPRKRLDLLMQELHDPVGRVTLRMGVTISSSYICIGRAETSATRPEAAHPDR